MILQIDKRFTDPDIVKYGCHLMSELFLLNRCGNIPLTVQMIEAAVDELRITKASYQPSAAGITYVIGHQLSMNNPDDVVKYFNMDFTRACRFESKDYICQEGEQELLQFTRPMENEPGKSWWHWVVGDGQGHVAYDPEGYSITVRDGTLHQKKIFTIIHKGVNA